MLLNDTERRIVSELLRKIFQFGVATNREDYRVKNEKDIPAIRGLERRGYITASNGEYFVTLDGLAALPRDDSWDLVRAADALLEPLRAHYRNNRKETAKLHEVANDAGIDANAAKAAMYFFNRHFGGVASMGGELPRNFTLDERVLEVELPSQQVIRRRDELAATAQSEIESVPREHTKRSPDSVGQAFFKRTRSMNQREALRIVTENVAPLALTFVDVMLANKEPGQTAPGRTKFTVALRDLAQVEALSDSVRHVNKDPVYMHSAGDEFKATRQEVGTFLGHVQKLLFDMRQAERVLLPWVEDLDLSQTAFFSIPTDGKDLVALTKDMGDLQKMLSLALLYKEEPGQSFRIAETSQGSLTLGVAIVAGLPLLAKFVHVALQMRKIAAETQRTNLESDRLKIEAPAREAKALYEKAFYEAQLRELTSKALESEFDGALENERLLRGEQAVEMLTSMHRKGVRFHLQAENDEIAKEVAQLETGIESIETINERLLKAPSEEGDEFDPDDVRLVRVPEEGDDDDTK